MEDWNELLRQTDYTDNNDGAGDVPFLSLLPNGDKRYRIQDNLGSTRVVLTADGAVYDWNTYEPFGTVLNSSGGQQNSDRLSYIGKEKDAESDLGDFGVRKYETETGRFLSTDPLWEKYTAYTPYNYCGNNPLQLKDPTGFDWWEKIVNFVSGKGFRDDTMEENVSQRDWENLTPQLALEAGIDPAKTRVLYSDSKGDYHYTTGEGGQVTIVMQKGGYEAVDESNLHNARSSIQHEKDHAKKTPAQLNNATDTEAAQSEVDAINYQQNHKTYKNTSSTYKQNIELYKKQNQAKVDEAKTQNSSQTSTGSSTQSNSSQNTNNGGKKK